MLVLHDRHHAVGVFPFPQQQRLRRGGRIIGRHCRGTDLTGLVLLAWHQIVLPATGVGAGTLVGVPVVHVAGQQTAPGVGNAERAVHKHLKLHLGAFAANVLDLLQRQLTREDHTAQALAAPKLDRREIGGVGLNGQMNFGVRPAVPHQHDHPGVGHDERIRTGFHDRHQVVNKPTHLVVVRCDVAGHVELAPARVGLRDALGQAVQGEIVVAHPQTVPGLTCVDSVRPVGKRIAHAAVCPRGGEQFRPKVHFGSPGGCGGAPSRLSVGRTDQSTTWQPCGESLDPSNGPQPHGRLRVDRRKTHQCRAPGMP